MSVHGKRQQLPGKVPNLLTRSGAVDLCWDPGGAHVMRLNGATPREMFK